MEPRMRQFVVVLEEIVKINELATQVSTGDEIADVFFSQGVNAVLDDLKQLLNDLGEGFDVYTNDRPLIPHGFRLHCVVTH